MKNLQIYKLIPNFSSDIINMYLKDIKSIPILTISEEKELLKRYKENNDEEALQKLILSNLRYVISIAKQYQYNYVHDITLEDLIQIGNIGLYKAISSYNDKSYSTRLTTYATYKIRGEILDSIISDKKGIHIPIYKTDQISKINKFIASYEQENQFSPTVDVIADYFNIDESEVKEILSASFISVEGDSLNESGESFISNLQGESEKKSEDSNIIYTSIYKTLSAKNADILCKAYGINCKEKSLQDIADEYNLSKRRISYIISDSLKLLRNNPELLNLLKGRES